MGKIPTAQQALRFSTRLYEALLAIYPAEFQQAYREPMRQVFRDCCLKALSESGAVGLLELWGRTIIDALQTALEEHSQRGVEMNKGKFIKLSGWGLVLAALALLLTFLPEADDITNRIYQTFGASSPDNEIQRAAVLARALPLPLAILLITLGLSGLSLRYGEKAGRAANVALILGVSGGLMSLIIYGLMLFGLVGGRPPVNISMGFMFSGLFIFGLVALRRKPMRRGNGLPILAGVWWPILVIQAYVFPQLTRPFMPEIPGWLSFSIFAVMSFFLAWLGYVVQDDAAQLEAAALR